MPTTWIRARRLFATALLLAGVASPLACEPSYLDTIAPEDANFGLSCAGSCGLEGREDGVVIDVTFVGHGRQFAVCCPDVPALRARLKTIQDFWCDGLDVPDEKVGDLIVGTAQSKVTKKRGATLDHGEGYVTFECDDWLPRLLDELRSNECCGPGTGSAAGSGEGASESGLP
jgi:hypothetical protein